MTKAQELFSSLMEKDSWIHVELGDDGKVCVERRGNYLVPT